MSIIFCISNFSDPPNSMMDNNGPFLDNSSFGNFDQDTSKRLNNPVVTFFHLIFRSLALIGKLESNISEMIYFYFYSVFDVWLVF